METKNAIATTDSSQRVAYDLMKHIADRTHNKTKDKEDTKEYWLTLYRQCYKAVAGQSLQSILKED